MNDYKKPEVMYEMDFTGNVERRHVILLSDQELDKENEKVAFDVTLPNDGCEVAGYEVDNDNNVKVLYLQSRKGEEDNHVVRVSLPSTSRKYGSAYSVEKQIYKEEVVDKTERINTFNRGNETIEDHLIEVELPNPGCEVTGYEVDDEGKIAVHYKQEKGCFAQVMTPKTVIVPNTDDFVNHNGVYTVQDNDEPMSENEEAFWRKSDQFLLPENELRERHGNLIDYVKESMREAWPKNKLHR